MICAKWKKIPGLLMSWAAKMKLSMILFMENNDRWRITWRRQKRVNGFTSLQEVVVYGIDNVQHVVENVVPEGVGWDVYPA